MLRNFTSFCQEKKDFHYTGNIKTDNLDTNALKCLRIQNAAENLNEGIPPLWAK